MSKIGELIRELAADKQITMSSLASNLGVSRKTLYHWLNTGNLDWQIVQKIETLLRAQIYDKLRAGDFRQMQAARANAHTEFRTNILRANSIDDIHPLLDKYVRQTKFGHFSYMQIYRGEIKEFPQVVFLTNVASNWSDLYIKKNLRKMDPVWEVALNRVAPFDSLELRKICAANKDRQALHFLDLLEQYGYPYLIFLPVHSAAYQSVLAISISDTNETSMLQNEYAEFFFSTSLLHQQIEQIFSNRGIYPQRHAVSARDLKILIKLIDGLTTNEIARRMELSPSAIKSRIDIMKQTFNAKSRQQLIAITMSESIHRTNLRESDFFAVDAMDSSESKQLRRFYIQRNVRRD